MLKRQRTYDPSSAWQADALSGDPQSWKGASLCAVEQMTSEGVRLVMDYADVCKTIVDRDGGCDLLKGKIMAAVFYEASTRTSCSFQAAMLRLGGAVIPVNSTCSSAKKGETLADTIRCLECYCDVLVLRHPEQGSADEAARVASVPVLNAGDGTGEHPTQALLDLYTMRAELGGDAPAGCVVTLAGDLRHGRTVHSLALILARAQFDDLRLQYVAPPTLELPSDVRGQVTALGASQIDVSSLDEGVMNSDVLYMTRIQQERFVTPAEYKAVRGSYVLNAKMMRNAKDRMCVLHPLPRVDEISSDVDVDPRAAYFRQMRNGMYVRMALLLLVCGVQPPST